MKKIYTMLLCILLLGALVAQPYATWTKTKLTLSNGIVERVIKLPADTGSFITSLYKPVKGDFKYFDTSNTDFQFEG